MSGPGGKCPAMVRSIVEPLWTRVRDRLVDSFDTTRENKRLTAKSGTRAGVQCGGRARDLQLLSRTIWRTVTADRAADPIHRVLAAGMRRARAIPEGSAYTETVEDVLGRASARALARTLADGDPRDWPERLHGRTRPWCG